MVCGFLQRTTYLFAIALLMAGLSPSLNLLAQDPGGGGGDDDEPFFGGIEIDASGILSSRVIVDPTGAVNQQRWQAARASLNQDLQRPSSMRCVSLNRLEREYARLIAEGQPIPEEMNFLAGLTSISHVFFYPETKDIVIAGPAEGFFVNSSNYVVGMETGSSVLQLQDLVVALRAFGPDHAPNRVISCSIDPTQEGILRMRDAVTFAQQNANRMSVPQIVQLFREALGFQQISINGVSNRTNFARVMIEADYRMKLIGIGLEQPTVPMTTYIQKATPTTVGQNALIRWFFQPKYDCIQISPDENAIQFVDGGVKLVGEDEMVSRDGQRRNTGRMNSASKAYTESFTKMYDRLAETNPLWGELRNLMKMSMAAAYIQKFELFEKSGWQMEWFGDETKFRTEIMNAPQFVAPVANAVFKNGALMTPIAGGVAIQPRLALNSDRLTEDQNGQIAHSKDEGSEGLQNLKPGQWWWD